MNELMTLDDSFVFNTEIIKRGGAIRLQGKSWEKPRNGLVIKVDKHFINVLTLSDVNSAINYTKITADDAANWKLLYTEDFMTVYGDDSDNTTTAP